MQDVTQILNAIEQGDPSAAEQLLPLVYQELRKLAAAKMAQEKPGQILQATALVHEAYLCLVDTDQVQHWNSRGHFSGPPPRRCGGFWSNKRDASVVLSPVEDTNALPCHTWIRVSRKTSWMCWP